MEIENQRYCQFCGSEILHISETPQAPIRMTQNTAITGSIPIPQYGPDAKKWGPPGSKSKMSLVFGLISLIIMIISLFIGFTLRMMSMMDPYSTTRRIYPGLIVTRVIGIIFGILSITISGNAKGLEPENAILKIGNALGIIGLVTNIIFIIPAL